MMMDVDSVGRSLRTFCKRTSDPCQELTAQHGLNDSTPTIGTEELITCSEPQKQNGKAI